MELRERKVIYSEEELQNRTFSGLFQTAGFFLYNCKGGPKATSIPLGPHRLCSSVIDCESLQDCRCKSKANH